MNEITITGASDDLIEIDGAISEEFNWFPDNDRERRFLAVSDGTLLSVRYDEDGLWRFDVLISGTCEIVKTSGSIADDTNDVITLRNIIGFDWIVFGTDKATIKRVVPVADAAPDEG